MRVQAMQSAEATVQLKALSSRAALTFGAEHGQALQPELEILAQAIAALWKSELAWQTSAPDFLVAPEVSR